MPHRIPAHRLLRAVLLAALAMLCALARPTEATAEPGVLRATLGNGLRVVIVHNSLAPVVATSVNYLVGSDEAPAGFPGTAHAEEHMMFRGSPGLTADQLADIGSILGGDFNANTRERSDAVPVHGAGGRPGRGTAHRGAAHACGAGSPKEWQNERGAIEQEVAQDLSGTQLHALREAARAICSPARLTRTMRWARGRPSTRPARPMLKSFHDTWYAPNNAILVIAGNVEPQAALTEVRQLFEDIPAKKLPPRPPVRCSRYSPPPSKSTPISPPARS